MRDLHHKNRISPNRNRQKREKKNRKPIQYRKMLRQAARAGIALVLAAVLWTVGVETYELVARMTFFKLERVEMSRLTRVSREDMLSLAGVRLGDSLLKLDLKSIGGNLGKNPWLEDITVRRRFPGSLSIEAAERVPAAVVNMGYLFYVDTKGAIFKPLTTGDRLDYPIVTGVAVEDLNRDPAGTKETMRAALGILGLLRNGTVFRLEDISEIHVDKGYGFTLFTAMGGIPVKLGDGAYEEKLERLSRIYRELSGQIASLEYIDLNYPDKIVVKKV